MKRLAAAPNVLMFLAFSAFSAGCGDPYLPGIWDDMGRGAVTSQPCTVGYRACDSGCCAWTFADAHLAPSGAFSPGAVISGTSLRLDALENPHISFGVLRSATAPVAVDLAYATRAEGGWGEWNVVPGGLMGAGGSLTLDSSGAARISHYDALAGDLRFVTFDRWNGASAEVVDAVGDVGQFTAQEIDATGRSHIAYVAKDLDAGWAGPVKYARQSGSGWVTEVVDATAWRTGTVSLALDSAGTPHLTWCVDCWDGLAGQLRYAKRDGAGWIVETVDAGRALGNGSSLALDANGNPRISYADRLTGTLKYAERAGNGWHVESVDAGGVGEFTSLAIDASGDPSIAYYDWNRRDLRFAQRTNDLWRVSVVDTIDDVGQGASLRLDSDGEPHITYVNRTRGALRYAN